MIADLVTLLRAQNFALVGQRIYAQEAEQDAALPFVVLTLMDRDHLNCLDGATGTEVSEVDLDSRAATGAIAAQIGSALKTFLRNYTGTMGSRTCRAVELVDELEPIRSALANGLRQFTHTLTCRFYVE